MKIYGNDYLLASLASMVRSGRTAHSVLFYGEKGCGKRTMAQRYIELLLCENAGENGEPCGRCTGCLNAAKGIHPDVLYAPKSGKLGGYSVETARAICSDAFIKPNNSSGRKIYVFSDCMNMDVRTQNTLLKIVEEPPDYAYFIFTSESKTDFLPTIISRCVCFGVSPCTEEDAALALAQAGFGENEIKEAVSVFHGNIGLCRDYLVGDVLRSAVNLTKTVVDSIINKDEYALNSALTTLGRDRDDVKNVLTLLDVLVRDAAVLSKDSGADILGCYRDGALRLSGIITVHQAARIHRIIGRAWESVGFNVSIPLALAAMSGEIMNCL